MDQAREPPGHPDYYALLGVGFDADDEAIRAAYRALAKQYHPDMADGEDAQSTERFLEIQEAYDVLRDVDRRQQYDEERARLEAQEQARQWQRDFADVLTEPPGSPANRPARAPKAFAARRQRTRSAARLFGFSILLVVVTAGVIVGQHRAKYLAVKSDQVTIVKVDNPNAAEGKAGGVSAELRVLSREVEELSRQQAAHAEAAKLKAQSQAMAAPTPSFPPTAKLPSQGSDHKIDCSGEGRSFSVSRQSGGVSISYNGGPLLRPVISDQGLGMIVVSKVEPTNRISIAFMKGDKDRTVVLINDATGNLYRTFGVECTAAAF